MDSSHPFPVKKSELVDAIVRQLSAEMALIATAAKSAHDEATHDEGLHENQFDTPGLETSVLAEGQVKVAAELREAADALRALELHDFAPDEKITLGALVETVSAGERAWYFVGPKAGGIEVAHDGHAAFVVTPVSPLGAKLLGRKAGDTIPGPRPLQIVSVR